MRRRKTTTGMRRAQQVWEYKEHNGFESTESKRALSLQLLGEHPQSLQTARHKKVS